MLKKFIIKKSGFKRSKKKFYARLSLAVNIVMLAGVAFTVVYF